MIKLDLKYISEADENRGSKIWRLFTVAIIEFDDIYESQRLQYICYMHPDHLAALLRFLFRNSLISQLESLPEDQDYAVINGLKVYLGYEPAMVFVPDWFKSGPKKFDSLVNRYPISC
jgi:hypothetical protein